MVAPDRPAALSAADSKIRERIERMVRRACRSSEGVLIFLLDGNIRFMNNNQDNREFADELQKNGTILLGAFHDVDTPAGQERVRGLIYDELRAAGFLS